MSGLKLFEGKAPEQVPPKESVPQPKDGMENILAEQIPSNVRSVFELYQKYHKGEANLEYVIKGYQRRTEKKVNDVSVEKYYEIGELVLPALDAEHKFYPQSVVSVVVLEDGKIVDQHTQLGPLDMKN